MAVQIPVSFEFRSNQTFANFLPGANLELISRLETLMEVADEQQLIIWGKKGSGKTHLLRAVQNQLRSTGASVGWLDAVAAIGGAMERVPVVRECAGSLLIRATRA